MLYLIQGEVIDTYGGDLTYRDVWCELEKEGDKEVMHYYKKDYGAKPSTKERIIDPDEIDRLKIIMMGFFII